MKNCTRLNLPLHWKGSHGERETDGSDPPPLTWGSQPKDITPLRGGAANPPSTPKMHGVTLLLGELKHQENCTMMHPLLNQAKPTKNHS